ncbi:MAG TPA: penicillin-binding protein 2 [Dehalococcoidia bacterium]|nr:penicillin-binding protein 2 [Dehalococcoidia bacterium]
MTLASRTSRSSWRIYAVALLMGLSAAGILTRLAILQLVHHQDYVLEAQGEHIDRKALPAHRGTILDRTGNPLATSVDTFDILVDRRVWQDRRVAEAGSAALAALLGRSQPDIQTATQGTEGDAVLARGVEYETGRRIEASGIAGVIASPSSRRIYPEGDLASALLGFEGQDQAGLTGVEHDLNEQLAGKAGAIDFERDSLGNPIAFGETRSVPAQSGSDVVLTIDRTLQAMAEHELDAAIQKTHADGGDVLMMDPQTGAVLAMASRPSFQLSKLDLNQLSDLSTLRLRTITDMYEPGSVFKLFTMAAALNEKKVNPNTTYVDTGKVVVGQREFHNWDFSVNGRTSMTQVLVKSLNTGSIFVSGVLGSTLFYRYVQTFGFGKATHVDLGGEAAGQFRLPDDPTWSQSDLAANSFGQGLNATPLQVLTAVCSIANGGKLMQPYVVQEVRDASGAHVTEPLIVRQTITPDTAVTLTQMMTAVVDSNALARVKGYVVAGKSGTAYVPQAGGSTPKNDAYGNEVTIPSYLGFAPLTTPRLAILVKLDDLGTADLGGQLTAPIFSKLMHDGLKYMHVPEDQPSSSGNP